MSDQGEVEALLARELAGFGFGDRHGSSEPLGARIINWRGLADDDAADAWVRLREWVEWMTVRYNVAVSVIPQCWWKHGGLVEELSALHIAHQAAFDDSDTGFGPIGWHERLAIALPRISRAYGGGCNNGHRPSKPRTWESATDEQEWDTWTSQAHGN
ncbi:hypothetical protein [Microbacterium invictum]|uniref:DUF4913 domain-containing protein n=1 Tax=Microbacterium invictum TaxID=515415 RepID=A0AA40VNE6_9MICO|nr:hypothetical protein [Microbacterium invictum]MBB4140779.1 hypothetical protein [Microbacterium invictum]